MIWVAPTEKDSVTETLGKRLWDSTDRFRANLGLKAHEYVVGSPLALLAIIFLLRPSPLRHPARQIRISLSPQGKRVWVRVPRRGSRVLK